MRAIENTGALHQVVRVIMIEEDQLGKFANLLSFAIIVFLVMYHAMAAETTKEKPQ